MIKYYFAHDSKFPAAHFISEKKYMTWKCVWFYIDQLIQQFNSGISYYYLGILAKKEKIIMIKICDILQFFSS